jgi:superfamily II DNA/RNA helicase
MTQSARLDALQKFKDGEVPLMIASDVAARGLDIAGLSHVFNFDVPGNAEDYVHRIGRTGRAGKSGRAFTIAASEDDKKYVGAIEKLIGKPIPLAGDARSEAPQDASEAKPASRSKKKKAGSRRTEADSPESGKTESGRKDASKTESASRNESGGNDDNRSRGGRSRRKQENAPGELPAPPECKGDTLQDTGHVPAFLLRS